MAKRKPFGTVGSQTSILTEPTLNSFDTFSAGLDFSQGMPRFQLPGLASPAQRKRANINPAPFTEGERQIEEKRRTKRKNLTDTIERTARIEKSTAALPRTRRRQRRQNVLSQQGERKGLRETILTSGVGILGDVPTRRKTLLGL